MGVLSVADVRPYVSTSLSDVDLQRVIDREEAYLESRIGQLVGDRVQRVLLYDSRDPIRLLRPVDTADVVTTIGGTPLTGVEVITNGWRLWRPSLDWPYPGTRSASLYVSSTPNDRLLVERVLTELVRLSVSVMAGGNTAGLKSETIGSYSYEVADGNSSGSAESGTSRGKLVRSLLPRYPTSVRVRSNMVDPYRLYPTTP